jgi:hypothetical protein
MVSWWVGGWVICPLSVIYTCEPISGHKQLFWEAFPAGSGPTDRTTYMFTYLDAEPDRPSLTAMLEEYWEAMPRSITYNIYLYYLIRRCATDLACYS